jgi:hypothetical protein
MHLTTMLGPQGRQHHQLYDIQTPHDHDVLAGRGNFVNYHAGNEHFRMLVRKHKVAYVACPKPQKGKFSQLIVDEIKCRDPPGRFLKQDPKTKMWYDIGEKKALDKTRQALREGAPDIQKELTGDLAEDCSSESMQGSSSSGVLYSQTQVCIDETTKEAGSICGVLSDLTQHFIFSRINRKTWART